MKIVSVTMVKNEENILESFVRHALTFSDQVVVYNHNSTDGTLLILRALKKEFGTKIIEYPEISDSVMTINQEVFNQMIRYAFEELEADMVLPLDGDEFPVLLEGGSVRRFLENLDTDCCYQVHFMPFSIAEDWKKGVFAPLLFTRRKKRSSDTDYKVILCREPFQKEKLEVGLGNHLAICSLTGEVAPVKDLFPDLFYAHYAFRNREHLEGKLVIRWLALTMRENIGVGTAFQYQDGYRNILEGKSLTQEEIDWFCLNNMCSGENHRESLEEIQKSIEKVEPKELFEPIELKYTEYMQEKSNYVLLMEFTEQVIDQYKKEKERVERMNREKDEAEERRMLREEELHEIQEKYRQLEMECGNLKKQCADLSKVIDDIRGSKAWKVIQMYRKLVGKHDPTFD